MTYRRFEQLLPYKLLLQNQQKFKIRLVVFFSKRTGNIITLLNA